MYKNIFLVTLFLITSSFKFMQCCAEYDDYNTTYIPPCNMKFPYGDEHMMACNVLENDTNIIICNNQINLIPEYGRCLFPPVNPEDMQQTDPYVKCQEFSQHPSLTQMPPAGDPVVASDALCKSCDLNLTPDGIAVNLKCTSCHDLPNLERTANFTEKELVYTAYFVQIANYTSVQVIGRENLNP